MDESQVATVLLLIFLAGMAFRVWWTQLGKVSGGGRTRDRHSSRALDFAHARQGVAEAREKRPVAGRPRATVVQNGDLWFLDGRAAPDYWSDYDSVAASNARGVSLIEGWSGCPSASFCIWVLPGPVAHLLEQLDDARRVDYLSRLRGGREVWNWCVLVDQTGWVVPSSVAASAKAARVEILRDFPTLIEPFGGSRSCREMVDRAARAKA